MSNAARVALRIVLFVFAVATIGGAAAAAGPALAAKGGGGPKAPSSATSSIAIASVDGANVATSTQSPSTQLGDGLKFATTVEPLAGWEYPMIDLSCYQDVNGDGTIDTSLLGPDIVFSSLDTPDATFTLGGYSSIWTLRVAAGASPGAVCLANLDAYGWKGGIESIRVLASTGNWTS